MYQNQIENEQRAFHIPIADRVDGLNHTSKLNSLHFGLQNEELKRFFFDMRDPFDNCHKENKKFLGVVLYMAGIEKERHDLKFEDFKTEEVFDIIKAINHIKAVTALLPKKLALPQ
ncbi:DUF5347 domain-containing protein [Proteus mirabilis]|nr:DUF5347 domain-containing protein [Proteus mirabilis]HEK2745631.1 DUF5347 domain-containing protein [Proteus mirabilis]